VEQQLNNYLESPTSHLSTTDNAVSLLFSLLSTIYWMQVFSAHASFIDYSGKMMHYLMPELRADIRRVE